MSLTSERFIRDSINIDTTIATYIISTYFVPDLIFFNISIMYKSARPVYLRDDQDKY